MQQIQAFLHGQVRTVRMGVHSETKSKLNGAEQATKQNH